MKKLLTLVMGLVLLSSLVFAADGNSNAMADNDLTTAKVNGAGQGVHEPGTGLEQPELRETARIERAAELGVDVLPEGRRLGLTSEGGKMFLQTGERRANCEICEADGEMIKAKLSNGRNAEVKFMPDRASAVAIERLGLKPCDGNCTIKLREVSFKNELRAAYEVKTERAAKMFGLFRTRMQVSADVDAETGEVLNVHKPWWAFLASEPEE